MSADWMEGKTEEEIFLENQGFIHLITKKWFRKLGNITPYEDLYQICAMAFVQAIRKYDPARGTKLISLAGILMEGEIYKYFNRHEKKWASFIHMDDIKLFVHDDSKDLRYEDTLENNDLPLSDEVVGNIVIDNINAIITEILNSSPERDRGIIVTYLQYISQGEKISQTTLGNKFNVSQVLVSRVIVKFKKQLQERLSEQQIA